MFITRTRCGRNWPRKYTVPHQEIAPPFRRCENATVIRIGRLGIVYGRWDTTLEDEYAAFIAALQARTIDPFDDKGHLLPNYHKEHPHG